MITVEDHFKACGFGSAVLEAAARQLSENGEKTPDFSNIRVLGAHAEFLAHGSRRTQFNIMGINADTIVKVAKEVVN